MHGRAFNSVLASTCYSCVVNGFCIYVYDYRAEPMILFYLAELRCPSVSFAQSNYDVFRNQSEERISTQPFSLRKKLN